MVHDLFMNYLHSVLCIEYALPIYENPTGINPSHFYISYHSSWCSGKAMTHDIIRYDNKPLPR